MENETTKEFDLLIDKAKEEKVENITFLISNDIDYEKETYKDFRVLKINTLPINSIYLTDGKNLFY